MKKKGNTMKVFLSLILLIFIVTGCAGLQTTDTQDYTIKKVARLAGIFMALEKPDDVQKVLSYCEYIDSLKTGKLKETALKVALEYIQKNYGSGIKAALLISEVTDLISYAVPAETGLEFDPKLLNMAIVSFQEGLALSK